MRITSRSEGQTEGLGQDLGQHLNGGEWISLEGQLGAGKTCFARGLIGGGLGVQERITSPTFALVHEYDGRLHVLHADFYRLGERANLEELGIQRAMTDPQPVVVVEWLPESLAQRSPPDVTVQFTWQGEGEREITMVASTPLGEQLLQRAG